MGVREEYIENLNKGMSPKDSAKLAQEKTGLSLRTGLPFRRTHRSMADIGKVKGQY